MQHQYFLKYVFFFFIWEPRSRRWYFWL